MVVPRGYAHRQELESEIERAERRLGPEVVRVRHSIGENMNGEPAVHFRIVLTDSASREEKLAEITAGITRILFDELRPIENWDLMLYFSFRSQSEQTVRDHRDPAWA